MVLPLYDDNPFRLPVKPVVTWLLILANVLVFLVEIGGSDAEMLAITNAFGVTPTALLGGVTPAPVLTLLTYMFIHADVAHIFGNMIFLWVFGDDVEEALGRPRFLLFYLICGAVGALTFVASAPAFDGPLIGASGAISGVVIAYAMWRPCAKVTVLVSVIPLRISALWVVGAFVLMQLWNLEATGKSDVAYWCHLGGMLAGAALFPLMKLPGVQLFECARMPHYPGESAPAHLADHEPRG
ncbi:MAG TPA: rhomboid family intramembrane serine protease [Xanthobacteraceae bacterium]|jgi:membrane associated rhomboid family serine protease|nr:rhomboid family intramembrane serine protease [Xanthobacteraceae bacterium]